MLVLCKQRLQERERADAGERRERGDWEEHRERISRDECKERANASIDMHCNNCNSYLPVLDYLFEFSNTFNAYSFSRGLPLSINPILCCPAIAFVLLNFPPLWEREKCLLLLYFRPLVDETLCPFPCLIQSGERYYAADRKNKSCALLSSYVCVLHWNRKESPSSTSTTAVMAISTAATITQEGTPLRSSQRRFVTQRLLDRRK